MSDTRKASECGIGRSDTLRSSHRETRAERRKWKHLTERVPHVLEGEDDGGDDPDDHEHSGGDAEESPAGGEVHLQRETREEICAQS